MTIFRTHDERLLSQDIEGCKRRLEELTGQFIMWKLPGPNQRRIARDIIELVRSILKKEEELVRIKKMSEEYTTRKS